MSTKHEQVAQMIIDMMEKGVAPWQQPWEGGNFFLPVNGLTNKQYSGFNTFMLMATAISNDYTDSRWLTFKQAQSMDAQVKKGEKGTPIVYLVTEEKQDKIVNGKPVYDEKGQKIKETVKLERPKAVWTHVFNAEQIDNMPKIERKEYEWNPIDKAEEFLIKSGAVITNTDTGNAVYNRKSDTIELPQKNAFPDPVDYYQTALHELGHWTGHESRLKRDMAHPFGTPGYAKEELIAEITSVLVGAETGLGFKPGEQNAAYVKDWVELLKNDPKVIFEAAASADKVLKYLVGLTQEQEVELEQAQEEQPRHEKQEQLNMIGSNSIHSNEEIEAALREAHTIGDGINLEGSQVFKRRVVEIAIRNGLKFDYQDRALSQYAESVDTAWRMARKNGAWQSEDGAWHTSDEKQHQTQTTAERKERSTELEEASKQQVLLHTEAVNEFISEFDRVTGEYSEFSVFIQNTLAGKYEFPLNAEITEITLSIPPLADNESIGYSDLTIIAKQGSQRLRIPTMELESVFNNMSDEKINVFLTEFKRVKDAARFPVQDMLSGEYKFYLDGLKLSKAELNIPPVNMLPDNEFAEYSNLIISTEQGDLIFNLPTMNLDSALTNISSSERALKAAREVDAKLDNMQIQTPLEPQQAQTLDGFITAPQLSVMHMAREKVDTPHVKEGDNTIELISASEEELTEALLLAQDKFGPEQKFIVTGSEAFKRRVVETALKAGLKIDYADERLERYKEQVINEKYVQGPEPEINDIREMPEELQQEPERFYINVPYTEKEQARELGAKWDRQEKSWYITENLDKKDFEKWIGSYDTYSPDHELENEQTMNESEKKYISVPYKEKEQARQAGAKWDGEAKSWYITDEIYEKSVKNGASALDKWTAPANEEIQKTAVKEYLAVPYEERKSASAAGALWDKEVKSWYKGPNGDNEKLAKWEIKTDMHTQAPAISPEEEFLQEMQARGYTGSDLPVFDGVNRRVPVEGDRGRSASGFYFAKHDEAGYGGYFMNNRTDEEIKWFQKGYVTSPEEIAKLQAQITQQKAEREAERRKLEAETAERVKSQIKEWPEISENNRTIYHEKKGINANTGTYKTPSGDLLVPAMNINGEIQTCQYIQPDGEKRFARNGNYDACFHIFDGNIDRLKTSKTIIICEGYATAASIYEATQETTIAAFNTANLEKVAAVVHEKYPDKSIIIAGDNDRHLVHTDKIERNKGKEEAEKIAANIGATVVVPKFNDTEQYAHLILESKNLLADKKALATELSKRTDFNDLASTEGVHVVKAQIRQALTLASQKTKTKAKEPEKTKSYSR